MKYRVVYEIRNSGSIGGYGRKVVTVDAFSENNAICLAYEMLHKMGYETRFPRRVELIEVTEETIGKDEAVS